MDLLLAFLIMGMGANSLDFQTGWGIQVMNRSADRKSVV